MKRFLWLIALLLIAESFALFEWVHPDEWQPEREYKKGSTLHEAGEYVKEKAGDFAEQAKHMGSDVLHGTKELGHEVGEQMKRLRQRSKDDLYEPMVRMIKHALNIFEEEDRFMEEPEHRIRKGWPSVFETNPKMWREYPDEYLLFVDVPGIPRSDLACNITRNHVVISGQHGTCIRPAKTARGEERLCLERGVMESVRIPEDVNAEKLECKFKDGVLIVRMPKSIVKGKKIPIREYVPSWSERAKEVKDTVMDKIGMHHDEPIYED